MAKKSPLEKAIEQDVIKHAQGLGYLVYKFTSPARRSVPDRVFIPPKGLPVFFIEFKRLGEKPTAAQAIEIAKIRAQGCRVFIVDDKAQGRCLVTDYLHGLACEDVPRKQPMLDKMLSRKLKRDPFF